VQSRIRRSAPPPMTTWNITTIELYAGSKRERGARAAAYSLTECGSQVPGPGTAARTLKRTQRLRLRRRPAFTSVEAATRSRSRWPVAQHRCAGQAPKSTLPQIGNHNKINMVAGSYWLNSTNGICARDVCNRDARARDLEKSRMLVDRGIGGPPPRRRRCKTSCRMPPRMPNACP
jgi:hypothetical protein